MFQLLTLENMYMKFQWPLKDTDLNHLSLSEPAPVVVIPWFALGRCSSVCPVADAEFWAQPLIRIAHV